jgi:hypothetical protein
LRRVGNIEGDVGVALGGVGCLVAVGVHEPAPEPPPTACQPVIAPDSKSSTTIVLGRARHPMRTELRANTASAATATALLRPRTPGRAPRC